MTPQPGDHFAHPDDDTIDRASDEFDIAREQMREELPRSFAFGVFGIPSRSLRDEDRAQEARRGASIARSAAFAARLAPPPTREAERFYGVPAAWGVLRELEGRGR